MEGEVVMVVNEKEMVRAVQVYVDSIYKVKVRVVGVKQKRTSRGMGRFEIRLVGGDK